MSRRRKILSLAGLTFVGLVIAFFDPIHTTYSAIANAPRSWIKKSSPMRGQLAYIWEHWEDPNLKESAAIRDLSAILEGELTVDSTSEEIRDHIRTHFQQPVFDGGGVAPATIWRQNAHGYPASFMDDVRVLQVRYYSNHDRFLYADVIMRGPKGADCRHIDLTPSVDIWTFPAPTPTKEDSSLKRNDD